MKQNFSVVYAKFSCSFEVGRYLNCNQTSNGKRVFIDSRVSMGSVRNNTT